jgi:hypothetical protein
MADFTPNGAKVSVARLSDPTAAQLSYLVPGLGQIYQGRIAKGLLFLACLYGMFFGGMAMGDWKNVYIVDTAQDASGDPPWDNNPLRLPRGMANLYNRLHYVGQFWIGVAAWPAIWQYNHLPVPSAESSPFLHHFERMPAKEEANAIQRQGKLPDIAWVYTVIAGVLNILVIYDAFAGPAFVRAGKPKEPENTDAGAGHQPGHAPQEAVAL